LFYLIFILSTLAFVAAAHFRPGYNLHCLTASFRPFLSPSKCLTMKKHPVFFKRLLPVWFLILLADKVISQNVLWNNSTAGTLWYSSTNWLPATSSSGWTPSKTAHFSGAGTRTIGINMATASLSLQKIKADIGAFVATNITIGNSSAVAGTLTLNGGGGDSVLYTQQATLNFVNAVAGGTSTMNIALVKDESRIISNGGTINIGCPVTGAGKSLKIVSTSLGGVVEMTGANSYTGITCLEGGGGATVASLNLNRTGGATLPSGNKIFMGPKTNLRIKTNQTLSEVVLASSSAVLIVENGATLTISGRLKVKDPLGIILNGTGKIAYTAGAVLEYEGDGTSLFSTTSKEFPLVNGPSNLVVRSMYQLTLHETRSISGNITLNSPLALGAFNLTAANVAAATSPVITNGTGLFYLTAIGTVPKTFPVAASLTTIADANPVTVSNGGGLTYGVKVETGLNPVLATSSNAVNRTWQIVPSSTPILPVNIHFGYTLSHVNAGYVSTDPRTILQYTTAWNTVRTGLTLFPLYPVTITTLTGGTSNRFAVQTAPAPPLAFAAGPETARSPTELPPVNKGFAINLHPSVATVSLGVEVIVAETAKLKMVITDGTGRAVFTEFYTAATGDNRFEIATAKLAAGIYYITGTTTAGEVKTVRFVKE
jgi:hypothetical protein